MAKSKSKSQQQRGNDSDGKEQKEMCCDGSGRTAEEHRHESDDGKCCVDK